MKKILFLLVIALVSQLSWSKDRKPNYYETHDPSPDSVLVDCSLSKENGLYSITAVDSIEG